MKLKRLVNYSRSYANYMLRKKVCGNYPTIFNIEVTNRCPMDCIICPRKIMTRKLGDMDFALYKKIIDQEKGYTNRIYLHHFGDPLLHPRLGDMIKYANSKGIRTELSTNPTLLSEKVSKDIIDSGLDMIHISLDGTNPETYRKIRGKAADYDLAVKRMKMFLDMKIKSKKKKPLVEMAIIRMRDTEDQIEEFKKMWNIPGVDVVEVKRYLTWDGSDATVLDIGRESVNARTRMPTYPCKFPWTSVTVLWDGRVVPCCIDHDGKYVLGDLNKEKLIDIWNSERMQELRRQHAKNDMSNNKLCATCFERKRIRLSHILGLTQS